MSASDGAGKLVSAEDGLTVVTNGNLLVNLWRRPPSVTRLLRLRAIEDRFVAGLAGRLMGVVSVIEVTAMTGLLGDEEDKLVKEITRRFEPHTVGMAHIVEGKGLKATTTRLVMSALNLFARPGYPIKIVDTAEQAAAWMAPHLPGIPATTIVRCVEQARKALPPEAATR